MSEVEKDLYRLLRDLEGLPVTLLVFNYGESVAIKAINSDGEIIDTRPLLEVTAKGEIVDQLIGDNIRSPIEMLRNELCLQSSSLRSSLQHGHQSISGDALISLIKGKLDDDDGDCVGSTDLTEIYKILFPGAWIRVQTDDKFEIEV